MITAKRVVLRGTVFLKAKTYFYDRQKIETNGTNAKSSNALSQLPIQTVVGFVVEVEVDTHNGETTGRIHMPITSAVLMVTHKHKGIVKDSSAIRNIGCRNFFNISSTNRLSVTKCEWTSAGRLKSRTRTVFSYCSSISGGAASLFNQII